MGISSALYSGVSGLNTNASTMNVIGNNLANANTIGFKGSRTTFSDLLSGSVSGSGGVSQVGRGSGLSSVDQIFSQGTFEATESGLDLAIEGDGFFILQEPGDDTLYYSRAGAFELDENSYLVSAEGLRVQGYLLDENGEVIPGELSDIQIPDTGLVAAQQTDTIDMSLNLDAAVEAVDRAGGVALAVDDSDTYSFTSSMQVYDSLGNAQLVTFYFTKTDDLTWDVQYSYESDDGDPATDDTVLTAIADAFTFDDSGNLTAPLDADGNCIIELVDLDFGNGSALQTIETTLAITQYASDSIVTSQDQNGYEAGSLTDIDINEEGVVTAYYTNGEDVAVAQLALSTFTNPNGLELAGSNLYVETEESGTPTTGIPGPELGSIYTYALEQSNVDTATEFVRMITAQRAFQANSKIITTVDELLNEVINLKR